MLKINKINKPLIKKKLIKNREKSLSCKSNHLYRENVTRNKYINRRGKKSDCIQFLLVTVDPIHTMALVLTRTGATLIGVNFTARSLEPCKIDEMVMDQ